MNLKRFSKSSNPVMSEELMNKASLDVPGDLPLEERMTTRGAIATTWRLGALMMMTAVFSYIFPNTIMMWVGAIGGLAMVVWAVFKKEMSPTLAPIYALFEGLFIGTITYIYGSMFDGIVFHAITLTMAVFFLMLFLYQARIIKVTEKFRAGVIMATGAVLVVYILSFVLSFFGINLPFLHEGGPIGIGISLLIVGIASLNLLLDFDLFEKGEAAGAPKWMESFAAMGLLVTLVWLYIEILRLLSMLMSRD